MTIVQNPRGLKRTCTGCGARFYDMNKRPILCPTCGLEFCLDAKMKPRLKKGNADSVSEPEGALDTAKAANDDHEKLDSSATTDGLISLDEAADLEEREDDADENEFANLSDVAGIEHLDDEDLDNLDALDDDEDA